MSIVKKYGAQSVVVSLDFKKVNDEYKIYTKNGTHELKNSLKNIFNNVIKDLFFGELYVNSINQDGTGNGYDMKLLDLIPDYIKVPIILSGGAGNYKHLQNGLSNKNVNAVATANLFNFIGDGLINARKNLLLNKCNLVNWEI